MLSPLCPPSVSHISLSATAVITVEVWTTTLRNVTCPPSQRNATTARASRTWWLSVHTRRWCPLQALRTPTPLPQGLPGPTSTYRRRRSSRAPPRQRAPRPPQRSPRRTETPRSGENPERSSDTGGGRGAGSREASAPPLPTPPPSSVTPRTPCLIYLTLVKRGGESVIFRPAQLWQRSSSLRVRARVNVCD